MDLTSGAMVAKEPETERPESPDVESDEEEIPHGPKSTAEYLEDFWQSSSLQGFPRVFTETVKFWKMFWFALFLLLVCGCIIQMVMLFKKYFEYSTTTSVTIEYKHLPLPSITICNVNPVRHSSFANHSSAMVRDEYARMTAHNESQKDHNTNHVYISRSSQLFTMMIILDEIETDTQLAMGHQINPMIQACMMYGINCDYSNFTENLSSEFGSCYTLNSADHEDSRGGLKIARPGLYYGGVDLVLFAEEKEYLQGFSYARGFRIAIHPYNTIANVEEDPIAIGTGEETFIKLKMSDITRLEPPYGQCSKKYSKNFTDSYRYDYNVASCNATCKEYRVATECGCMYKRSAKFYTEEQQNFPSCQFNESLATCGADLWNSDATNCSCPLPCSEIKYAIQTSSNPWGFERDFDDLVGELCKNEVNSSDPNSNCAWLRSTKEEKQQDVLRNNFAKVRIYFNELLYDVEKEQQTYDSAQLMADFGGNFGLWVGASICTILEFVELFAKICVSKMQRTNRCHGAQDDLFQDTRRKRKKKKNDQNGNPQEIPLQAREAMA